MSAGAKNKRASPSRCQNRIETASGDPNRHLHPSSSGKNVKVKVFDISIVLCVYQLPHIYSMAAEENTSISGIVENVSEFDHPEIEPQDRSLKTTARSHLIKPREMTRRSSLAGEIRGFYRPPAER